MTPAARIMAAITVLEGLAATRTPADRFIAHWMRQHRYAGSTDRRDITELVFAVLRHQGYLATALGGETNARALVIAHLAASGTSEGDIAQLFDGSRYAPAELSQSERQTITIAVNAQRHPRDNVPAWLVPELERSLGANLDVELVALEQRAGVDIRINQASANIDSVITELAGRGIIATQDRRASHALRLVGNLHGLERDRLVTGGLVAIQDIGSQIAAACAQASEGQTIIDLCAGAGGKTLAIAAGMKGRGRILACDIETSRLERLKERVHAARADVLVTLHLLSPDWLSAPQPEKSLPSDFVGHADTVFVDAPCSGSGVWRRSPGNKWHLTPERLAELQTTQRGLLKVAARLAHPRGRIVYVTCSILMAENEDCIADTLITTPLRQLETLRLSPARDATDGFFVAVLERLG